MDKKYITKTEIIASLKEDGWDGIYGSFEGGGDEGGWEQLYLFKTKRGVKVAIDNGAPGFTKGPINVSDGWANRVKASDGVGNAFSKKTDLPHWYDLYTRTNHGDGRGWVTESRDYKYAPYDPETRGCKKIQLTDKEKRELKEKQKVYEKFSCYFDNWLGECYGSFAGEYHVSGNCTLMANGKSEFWREERIDQYEEARSEAPVSVDLTSDY